MPGRDISLTHCPIWVTAEARHGEVMMTSELVVPLPVIVLSTKARHVVKGAGTRGGAR